LGKIISGRFNGTKKMSATPGCLPWKVHNLAVTRSAGIRYSQVFKLANHLPQATLLALINFGKVFTPVSDADRQDHF
jgi:hypothetical protein